MSVSPVRRYKNRRLTPIIKGDKAWTDAIKLAPGTYLAGQVLGRKLDVITAAADVQTLTINATGGTFQLSFNGALTTSLAWNITAAALQTALDQLATLGNGTAGQVSVAGGPGATAPLVITFANESANLPQPVIAVAVNAVTGGTGAVTVAHTTTGRGAGGLYNNYNNANSDGTDVAAALLEWDTYVDNQGRHYAGGAQLGTWDYNAIAFFGGIFRTVDLVGLDAAGITDLGRIIQGTVNNLTGAGTLIAVR